MFCKYQAESVSGSEFTLAIQKLFVHFMRRLLKQESPAVADKPARRESVSKIAPIRRAYMYNVVADNTGLSSLVWLLVRPKSAKSREILWKFKLIEFKVIHLGANQKRICTFLLATNSNFRRISYRFRDIDAFISKIACFPTPPLFDAPSRWNAMSYRRNLYIAEKCI